MKRTWAALLLCGALSLTIVSVRAHDLDFPNQLRAINFCHTQWSKQHPGKAITDTPLVACMKAQGFRFDPNRQIKGVGPCHGKTRIILTAMQNHQRRAQAEPTQRSELRAFQVIHFVWEEH